MSEEPTATILIVDDHPTNLGVLYDMLTKSGYRVLVAEGGNAALLRAKKGHPDLILLDAMMPDMDGFEVCQALKKDAATAAIPVVFVTALTDSESKTRAFNLGAVDFISKPIQRKATLACVARSLKQSLRKPEPATPAAKAQPASKNTQLKPTSLNEGILSAVMHDLRGSLGGAIGLLEGIQDELKEEANVEAITDSCHWLHRSLIGMDEALHVLTLRRSLLSDFECKPKECDCLKALQAAAVRATELIQIPSVTLSPQGELPKIHTDTFLLEEFYFLLFRSLCTNTVDETSVTIKAGPLKDASGLPGIFLEVPMRPFSEQECRGFFNVMTDARYRRIRGVGISLVSFDPMLRLLGMKASVEAIETGNRFIFSFSPTR